MAERRGNGLQIRVHGFESRLHLGRLAQLVARFPDTEEVISSSLVPPTITIPGLTRPGVVAFRPVTRTPVGQGREAELKASSLHERRGCADTRMALLSDPGENHILGKVRYDSK